MVEPIGRKFQTETQIARLEASEQKRGLPQPPLCVRLFPGREVDLTAADDAWGQVTLVGAMRARRSLREYAPEAMSLAELAALLWATQGVSRTRESAESAQTPSTTLRVQQRTFRTVPSAGARHALETVLMVSRVDGLAEGVYQYLPLEHRLLAAESLRITPSELASTCLNQRMIENAALTFVWIAIRERMTWRYGERGYRYLYLDAGHVCQNLHLACEAIGAGACPIGAFDDAAVNKLLCVDGVDQFVIYLASVGKRIPEQRR